MACDAYVLAQLMRLKEEAVPGGQLGDAGYISSAQPAVLACSGTTPGRCWTVAGRDT